MTPLELVITNEGLAAIADAQNGGTAACIVTEIGLSFTDFVAAPTLEELPGEFKRIASVAGQPVDASTVHLTARDLTDDNYQVRGFGLFLQDGTLLAAYCQSTPIFHKAGVSTFLLALDIKFAAGQVDVIEFGDASFIYPPATEQVKGVAEIATQAEVDAAADHEKIVTPLTLGQRLGALLTPILDAIDALNALVATKAASAVQILTAGLATGGGDLTADRTITVPKASAAEAEAGLDDSKAITPLALAGFAKSLAQNGYCKLPGGLIVQWGRFTTVANGSASVSFPIAFPNACFAALTDGGQSDAAAQDNYVNILVSSITTAGFSAFNGKGTTYGAAFIAIGN